MTRYHRTAGPTRRPVAVRTRPVAERALRQVRLVAVGLIVVTCLAHGPGVPGDHVLPVLGVAAAVLLTVALLPARAAQAGAGGRSGPALAATVADAVVVLGVVATAGLPPRSSTLVLLLLPLVEAALWSGLAGLIALWTASSAALGALVLLAPDDVPTDALRVLAVAMPALLLAGMPIALLAEHLVTQVDRAEAAREAADDRARLLGAVTTVTADVFAAPHGDAVLARLADGVTQLGAAGATVVEPVGGRHAGGARVAVAGDHEAVTAATEHGVVVPTAPEDDSAVLRRDLPVPGGEPYVLTALLIGPPDAVARRVEAVDLLVAHARVALAQSVLGQQLAEHIVQATADREAGRYRPGGVPA